MLRHSVSLAELQASGWANPLQMANNEVLTSAVTLSADDSGRLTARQVCDAFHVIDEKSFFSHTLAVYSCKTDCIHFSGLLCSREDGKSHF
jgi:hypothetical protein